MNITARMILAQKRTGMTTWKFVFAGCKTWVSMVICFRMTVLRTLVTTSFHFENALLFARLLKFFSHSPFLRDSTIAHTTSFQNRFLAVIR